MLSSKSSINTHQKKTKFCLKIQGKDTNKGGFMCNSCGKYFLTNNRYKSHTKICKSYKKYIEKIRLLEQKICEYKTEIDILRADKKDLYERYDNISLTAVKRHTSTKNVQINNFIKNMEPLRVHDIKETIPMLTLDHHVKGAEGYAEFALEFPFKDKIVCVDVARNKIKYKNDEGDVIEDMGFRKMMVKLCESLKDRSFDLCQEHYEKLSQQFTEEEVDKYNFMEAAMAITKYANGRESEFCNKVIKLISRGSQM